MFNIEIINNLLASYYEKYQVRVAFQTGRAHKIPYIGIFNKRLTTSSKTGFYTVLLFDIFKKELFISLNIGENKISDVKYQEIKDFLKLNLDKSKFTKSDTLDQLNSLSTLSNAHYSSGNIIGVKIRLLDIKNSTYNTDVENIILSYLSETDRLVQLFLTKYPSKTYDVYIDPSYIKNYIDYKTHEYCEVEGCNNLSNFAVFLYDKYSHNDEEFLDHDFTCGYICETHMIENESSCLGERSPRNSLVYKYTNKNGAQGYTKYLPLDLDEVYKLKIFSENSKEDYLEVSSEVQVFHDLITQDDLELPLNVGIFGDWGSGKSFFIKELSKKLKNNNDANANIKAKPLVIEFNAWNYYDSNIIVNLVYRIFESILDRCKVDSEDLFQSLEHYKVYTDKKLVEQREEIFRKINSLQTEKEEIQANIENEFFADIGLSDTDRNSADKIINEVNSFTTQDVGFFKRLKFLLTYIFRNPKSYFYIFMVVIISLFIKFFVASTFFSILPGLLSIIYPMYKIYKKIDAILNKYFTKVSKQAGIESRIQGLKTELRSLEKVSNEELSLNYMRDFIIEKINHEGYKNNLGFIATISKDIQRLDEIIKEIIIEKNKKLEGESNEFFEISAITKIVLIIDDLDRCPEEKVVDVLQAIQLLLSTNLFVVIIAVDTRWINKCITSHYDKMLSVEGETDKNLFAINYLEKIIHLPYWLKKMNKTSSVNFIGMIGKNINANLNYEQIQDDTQQNDSNNAINPSNSDNKTILRSSNLKRRKFIDNEKLHLIDETDLRILNNMEFLFANTNPRKAKRFLNTILLVKNNDSFSNKDYNLILYIIASIVLKSDYTCKFYNFVLNKKCSSKQDFVSYLDEWLINEEKSTLGKEFWRNYINYLDGFSDETLKDINSIISELSRFTYYHEEITCSIRNE